MSFSRLIPLVPLLGLLFGSPLSAETVYIVTDDDGNKTYLDHPPEGPVSGTVETKIIDPDANVVPAGDWREPSEAAASTDADAGTQDTSGIPKTGDQAAVVEEEGAFEPAPDPLPPDTSTGTEAPGAPTAPGAPLPPAGASTAPAAAPLPPAGGTAPGGAF